MRFWPLKLFVKTNNNIQINCEHEFIKNTTIMILFSLLYLTGIALILTIIFTKLLRIKGPWGSFWTFFSIVLLAILATDLWIAPVGPYYEDIYWLPPLVVGVIIAILLAATSPPHERKLTKAKEPFYQVVKDEHPGVIALGVFFWFLMFLMLVIVIAGYVSNTNYTLK